MQKVPCQGKCATGGSIDRVMIQKRIDGRVGMSASMRLAEKATAHAQSTSMANGKHGSYARYHHKIKCVQCK